MNICGCCLISKHTRWDILLTDYVTLTGTTFTSLTPVWFSFHFLPCYNHPVLCVINNPYVLCVRTYVCMQCSLAVREAGPAWHNTCRHRVVSLLPGGQCHGLAPDRGCLAGGEPDCQAPVGACFGGWQRVSGSLCVRVPVL